jgi:hypothetical protein
MSEENRKSEKAFYSTDGETNADPEHLMIRSTLLNLPQVSCPAGFEARLQRRLVDGPRVKRNVSPVWNWMTGFTAAGLGVTAAVVIAVFGFNVSLFENPQIQMAQGPTSVIRPAEAEVTPGQSSFTGSPERIMATDVPQQDALTSAIKDSASNKPHPLPEGKYQVVDGAGR